MPERRDFGLLEAILLLALVVPVAAWVLPGYQTWQRDQYRAQARVALTALAADLEARHRQRHTYAGAAMDDGRPVNVGAPALAASTVPSNGGTVRYRLHIAAAGRRHFEIHAVPVGDQSEDPCGTLTLDSTGKRGIANADVEVSVETCWED